MPARVGICVFVAGKNDVDGGPAPAMTGEACRSFLFPT